MTKYLVLLGPPGVCKGTQAKILSERTGLAHISSGDLFRENIKNQTELGQLAQTYINRGELVPDDITIAMIRERLSRPDCKIGAILDGFPRTPAQAEALEMTLEEFKGCVDAVPFISSAEDVSPFGRNDGTQIEKFSFRQYLFIFFIPDLTGESIRLTFLNFRFQ